MDNYIAKTFQGLEPVLAEELRGLGALNVQELKRAVSFDADKALLYKANMALRTALHILLPLAIEKVRNQDELYQAVRSINWNRWFNVNQTYAVRAIVNNSEAFNTPIIVALKTKDAIADQFRQIKGERPSVDKDNPDIEIHIHIFGTQCTISIDSSGSSLHRRGYRTGGHPAPLNEVLAAGMVLLSGWDKNSPLVDFMCGSGTILTEAALIAANKAPNLRRKKFSFHYWKNFDEELFNKASSELIEAETEFDNWIYGSDIEAKSIKEARQNILAAGVDDMVRISQADFRERTAPKEPGTVIINPPYGERIKPADLELMYKEIGDCLKQKYSGYNAWILSSNPDGIKKIGLKAAQRLVLFNAALECRFLKYELYSGTQQPKKEDPDL
jgi:putative N6-adenine-specific DNA methylase